MTGRELNRKWQTGAKHALYRKDGTWYHVLKRFPGVMFDEGGYVLFETERDYRECYGLVVGTRSDWAVVEGGISTLKGYVRFP